MRSAFQQLILLLSRLRSLEIVTLVIRPVSIVGIRREFNNVHVALYSIFVTFSKMKLCYKLVRCRNVPLMENVPLLDVRFSRQGINMDALPTLLSILDYADHGYHHSIRHRGRRHFPHSRSHQSSPFPPLPNITCTNLLPSNLEVPNCYGTKVKSVFN